MLSKLDYTVSLELLKKASNSIPHSNNGVTINQPTGNFFYGPWIIKEEFKNTVWEQLLQSLPGNCGEARIITLKHGTCYHSHADIDDRYHLNIAGQYSFLINLDKKEMFETTADGIWYEMNAGVHHVAANFGNCDRTQLVVRQLLPMHTLLDPVRFTIENNTEIEDSRYIFDDVISPQLNMLVKQKYISNVSTTDGSITFDIERTQHSALLELVSTTPLIVK